MSLQPRRYLAPDGTATGDLPLSVDEIRELYGEMVVARGYDRKSSAMQRQGRLATYAPYEGQEAAQIGAVSALEPRDWLVASYRDAAAMALHGYPWRNLILGRTGDERGGHAPEGVNVLPPSITVGGHMIHAVGIAWAERLQGTDAVALTMFGDGATSEGDFHEAMNFAAVFAAPTIFFCQNNGWAISMPRSRQTAAETIAQKADGYGMPGVLVDGNDVVAVRAVVAEAVARARAGGGPTLVEALTYRIGPHTTTDDPGRYREDAEVEEWRERDPLRRVRVFLEANDAWDDAAEQAAGAGVADQVEAAVAEAEALSPLTAEEIFEAVFADPTSTLEEQRRRLLRDGR
ncbi:MAG: pyruvate dehydrogenase (acetyl-transferring) E1 component subunit alpha [Acidimicrobiia bacterium]